jgi:hypothetical protein
MLTFLTLNNINNNIQKDIVINEKFAKDSGLTKTRGIQPNINFSNPPFDPDAPLNIDSK